MKKNLFVYRREAVIPPPYPKEFRDMLAKVIPLVVAIVGKHDCFVSALHIGVRKVATYHEDYFEPREALVGKAPVSIVKVSRKDGYYRDYELAVSPDHSIANVADKIDLSDYVFQIGVRQTAPGTVSVGILEPFSKYFDQEEDVEVDTGSESGSGVFASNGSLLGMTLGKVGRDAMVGVPIASIL